MLPWFHCVLKIYDNFIHLCIVMMKQAIALFLSLNSIYFQISIYTWQHTLIQIHGKGIGKQVTYFLNPVNGF